MTTLSIKGNDMPAKVNLGELEALIKERYPRARVAHYEARYQVTPNAAGEYKDGVHLPAQIVVDDLPADVEERELKKLIASHKPDKTEREIRRERNATALFDLISLDPRMKALLELVGPK